MRDPQGMYNMSGWTATDCAESDRIRSAQPVSPASTLTDPNGTYSSGVVFTEWWDVTTDAPILRDYRWTDEAKPCEHFIWTPEEQA